MSLLHFEDDLLERPFLLLLSYGLNKCFIKVQPMLVEPLFHSLFIPFSLISRNQSDSWISSVITTCNHQIITLFKLWNRRNSRITMQRECSWVCFLCWYSKCPRHWRIRDTGQLTLFFYIYYIKEKCLLLKTEFAFDLIY